MTVMERPIEASTIIAAASDRVGGLLRAEPEIALPNPATLSVGAVHHQVVVTVDDAHTIEDRVVVPVSWHATGNDHLFPTFLGELSAEPSAGGTRLRLAGTYTVPLGLLGRFGDGVVGRRLAAESIRAFLADVAGRVATALEIAVELAVVSVDELPSEVFIG